MKILVGGASGLIGSHLVPLLKSNGHEVISLKRGGDGFFLTPERGWEGFDAVINLAGETVAKRWSASQKIKIRNSRVQLTEKLVDTLIHLKNPPKILINASAIGYYGSCGEQTLDETSPPGTGFLAEVAQAWEAELELAKRAGIRTVALRTGVVLSPKGGALAQMLTPFKLCLGGRLGDGQQFMSWIAIEDVTQAILYALTRDELKGALNLVSPNPLRNEEFTKTLGATLHRPTVFPVPAYVIKIIFGEMGQALLLSSAKVYPSKLKQSGYTFLYPTLEGALKHQLGKK